MMIIIMIMMVVVEVVVAGMILVNYHKESNKTIGSQLFLEYYRCC